MRFFIVIFLLSFSLITSGQKKIEQDQVQFNKIVELQYSMKSYGKSKDSLKILEINNFNKTLLEKVVNEYTKFLVKFPNSNLIFKAMSNKGEAQLTLDKSEDAKITFLELINSNAHDRESISHNIYSEPYANYKNRAAKRLAEIEFRRENFKESIRFLELTKIYKYNHYCGNELIKDIHDTELMFAKCYFKLKNYKQVNALLLQRVFDNNDLEASNLLYNNLLQVYKKEQLKTMFDKAVKNIVTQKKIEYNRTKYYYYITFLNTKIELSLMLRDATNKIEFSNAVDDFIKNSKFCNLLL